MLFLCSSSANGIFGLNEFDLFKTRSTMWSNILQHHPHTFPKFVSKGVTSDDKVINVVASKDPTK